MVRKFSVLLLSLALLPAVLFAQNQSNSKPTDAQILAQANRVISQEQAFKGMDIVPSVSNGVVTLSGTVSNYAAKVLASDEMSNIKGVRTVLNNLNVAPSSASSAPSQQTQTQPYRNQNAPPQQQSTRYNQQSSQYGQQQMSSPPPAQPYKGPSVTNTKNVILPSGTLLPVRLSNEINTKTAQANDIFHAELVHDVTYHGYVLIPHGTIFVGRIISAQPAGRFSGYPELSIELISFVINTPKGPKHVSVITQPLSSRGKGRGKNTAKKAGGGALLGAIIGAVAGGGKGAAIGALSGGAFGAGMNIKRGQEIDLKPEQLLQFKTSDTTVVPVFLHNGVQIPPTPSTTPILHPTQQQQPQQPQRY